MIIEFVVKVKKLSGQLISEHTIASVESDKPTWASVPLEDEEDEEEDDND